MSEPRWRRWALLGLDPPPPGAGQGRALRFIRDLQLRSLLVFVPILVVVVAIGAPVWLIAVVVAGLVVGLANALTLHVKARRADEDPPREPRSGQG